MIWGLQIGRMAYYCAEILIPDPQVGLTIKNTIGNFSGVVWVMIYSETVEKP